ncbi:hypothetical protein, partial [Mesorhizobium sp.]|uniref:hypothetical protein n=1 Tax=Mesorhizobium sp. TaxID=1871066 RepID=UPI0025BBBEB6
PTRIWRRRRFPRGPPSSIGPAFSHPQRPAPRRESAAASLGAEEAGRHPGVGRTDDHKPISAKALAEEQPTA